MSTKKILIVEDDTDLIGVLTTILEREGYQVLAATSKEDGLKKAREERPDLAILDVMMSTQYEGFEMAEALIRDEELRGIPILIQTSIEVLATSNASVRDMAREYRQRSEYKDLQVILLRDDVTGSAGIDYRAEDGRSVWLPVSNFLKKPVDAKKLTAAVREAL